MYLPSFARFVILFVSLVSRRKFNLHCDRLNHLTQFLMACLRRTRQSLLHCRITLYSSHDSQVFMCIHCPTLWSYEVSSSLIDIYRRRGVTVLPCTTTRENRWLIFRVFSTECSSLVPSVSIRYLFTKYDTGFASEFKWKETFVHRKTDVAWTMGKISAGTAMTKISVWKTFWKPSWKDWLEMGIATFPDNNYHEF